MLLDDWQMKVHEIAGTIGISKERVGYILHKDLDNHKRDPSTDGRITSNRTSAK